MSRHLVVEVKERDLQEYIDKLDSKGWAVMDIEPSNKVNYCSLGIGAIGIIIAALTAMKVIPHDVAKYCAVVIGLAFFSTFGITSTSMYTVVSEYIGNDEYIDITPFDDTDDKFVKNENYVEKTDKAGNGDEVTD